MRRMAKSRPLESFRVFPYIAWLLVISFAFFVYSLANELKETQSNYNERTQTLEARATQDPMSITDFTP